LGVLVRTVRPDAQGHLHRRCDRQTRSATSSRPYLLYLLGSTECVLGDLDRALDVAATGTPPPSNRPAAVCRVQPRSAEPRSCSARPRGVGERRGRPGIRPRSWEDLVRQVLASSALGHLEHALGAPARVVECLEPTLEFVLREAIVEPSATRFVIDQIEALIELNHEPSSYSISTKERASARASRRSPTACGAADYWPLSQAPTRPLPSATRSNGTQESIFRSTAVAPDRSRGGAAPGEAQARGTGDARGCSRRFRAHPRRPLGRARTC
jgi:hypothetical protein